MSFPRPTVLPEWAVQDIVDPVSMQNNVLTPPPEMQQYGWTRKQFPPRNWFNWLARYTYQWLAYLSQQDQQAVVTDGTGSEPLFNTVTGGIAILWVVDTGNSANVYNGMAYIPPASGSPITLITIKNVGLTISTISTGGVVTVSGGTGPYLCWGQTKTSP